MLAKSSSGEVKMDSKNFNRKKEREISEWLRRMLKEERRDSKGKEGDPATNKENLKELRVHWKRPTLHIIEQRSWFMSAAAEETSDI